MAKGLEAANVITIDEQNETQGQVTYKASFAVWVFPKGRLMYQVTSELINPEGEHQSPETETFRDDFISAILDYINTYSRAQRAFDELP